MIDTSTTTRVIHAQARSFPTPRRSPAAEAERLIEAGDLRAPIEAFTKAIRRGGSAGLYLARGGVRGGRGGEGGTGGLCQGGRGGAAGRGVPAGAARLAAELGQTETVIADCTEVLRASAEDAEALKLRGDAYRRAGIPCGRSPISVRRSGSTPATPRRTTGGRRRTSHPGSRRMRSPIAGRRSSGGRPSGLITCVGPGSGASGGPRRGDGGLFQGDRGGPGRGRRLDRAGGVPARPGAGGAALADGEQAVEARPNDPAALYTRGVARSRTGDQDGAVADLSRAIELDPSNIEALFARGNVRLDVGRFQEAIADYDRVLKLNRVHLGRWAIAAPPAVGWASTARRSTITPPPCGSNRTMRSRCTTAASPGGALGITARRSTTSRPSPS